MTSEIKTVLVRWEKSVKRSNSLDKWSLDEDFNKLSSFIRNTKDKSLKAAISRCRNLAIKNNLDYECLTRALDSALRILADRTNSLYSDNVDLYKIGQRERYHDITKSISKEKIKCCESKYLRNLDITIMLTWYYLYIIRIQTIANHYFQLMSIACFFFHIRSKNYPFQNHWK